MSIETILKNVAPEALPPDPGVVDADLARGRAALTVVSRRRTHRRLAGSGVLVAAAAAVVVLAGSGGSRPLGPSTPTAKTGQIKLVDYSGAQLPGFTVSQVPQGWQLSTSSPYALLITPDGSTNKDPADFAGKLAVLTSSTDQQGLGNGDAVTVNGQAGRVSEQPGYLILNYTAPNGFGVNIQAPDALGWNDAQIVAFAEGVKVTSNAIHSHG